MEQLLSLVTVLAQARLSSTYDPNPRHRTSTSSHSHSSSSSRSSSSMPRRTRQTRLRVSNTIRGHTILDRPKTHLTYTLPKKYSRVRCGPSTTPDPNLEAQEANYRALCALLDSSATLPESSKEFIRTRCQKIIKATREWNAEAKELRAESYRLMEEIRAQCEQNLDSTQEKVVRLRAKLDELDEKEQKHKALEKAGRLPKSWRSSESIRDEIGKLISELKKAETSIGRKEEKLEDAQRAPEEYEERDRKRMAAWRAEHRPELESTSSSAD